ncbi:MAG: LuxR C-terminal-related transcriptional regulator [Clostridiales Family XIII bacterium]|jgi:LuxR family maltose regulon positive regulatory protein|nr:LuxR C-terminal-related transcriptional regulator [Clostridiales Family XIII bacterium]
MNTRIYHSGLPITQENRVYLERPRVHGLLEDAVRSPLVAVSAGAGYGKTQAVHSFLRQYDAVTTWIQLSERDNLGARFWENFARTIMLYNKHFAERLLEAGFPETEDQFMNYLSIPEDEIPFNEKNVFVFDDFHLLENKSVLRFISRSIRMSFPNLTMILISRTEPDVNIVGMLSKGLAVSVSEEDLRFTEEETARYFQLLGVPMTSRGLSNIYNDTAGWAFAISLVGLSLKKAPSREREARAAMKLNIFKMIEDDVFLAVSEGLRYFLIRLSLIDHLSADLILILAEDKDLVDEMKKISSFIRYDIYTQAYLIHHLFLDYLRQKQDVLTEEDKRDTYLKAARWCDANDYKIDAISYYGKAGEYESIIDVVYQFPLQIPMDPAKFILDIYDSGPRQILEGLVRYHIQHTRLLLSLGRYAEAIAEINERIKKYSALPASDFNNRVLCGAYEALGFAGYLDSPRTDRYDFAPALEKADEYYRLSPYAQFGAVSSVSVDPWASKVGTTRSGAMEEYISVLERAIPHVENLLNGCMSGLDDLAKGELQFYKGNLKLAEKFITQSLYKSEARKQYEVRNRALFYLLRIGAAQGRYERTQEIFEQLEAQLEFAEYLPRFTTFEIVSGWYYTMIGQHQNVAAWIKGHFAQGYLGSFNASFGNVIRARYYYISRRYDELLSFIESEQDMSAILFGKLEMKALEAVCRYQAKQKDAALTALREAYDLSLSNDLITPFIELGKDMRALIVLAGRDKDCPIPKEWLEMIGRKAAIYSKQLAIVASEYKRANNISDDVRLSSKETDILNDLYMGVSRAQIAANRHLSVNTVKLMQNSVYIKLGADNPADVIRIALSRNLIGNFS